MGAWGADIFEDDLALDLRDSLEEELSAGLDMDEAVRRVLEEYGDALNDADDTPVFWLALASIQIDHGELQADVRRQALAVIEEGGHSKRWEGAGAESYAQRQRVLEDLRARLLGTGPVA